MRRVSNTNFCGIEKKNRIEFFKILNFFWIIYYKPLVFSPSTYFYIVIFPLIMLIFSMHAGPFLLSYLLSLVGPCLFGSLPFF